MKLQFTYINGKVHIIKELQTNGKKIKEIPSEIF